MRAHDSAAQPILDEALRRMREDLEPNQHTVGAYRCERFGGGHCYCMTGVVIQVVQDLEPEWDVWGLFGGYSILLFPVFGPQYSVVYEVNDRSGATMPELARAYEEAEDMMEFQGLAYKYAKERIPS